MFRHTVAAAAAKSIGMPLRIAGISIEKSTFEIMDPADYATVLWRVLNQCVVPAEQHAHFQFGDGIPVALTKIDVTFVYWVDASASILAPLITNFPAVVGSLRLLKIAGNKYDESAALGAFAALATRVQDLSFRRCGLTSVRGLEGHCEYLQKLDLDSCFYLRSLEGLEHHMNLEEVDASHTAITSIEPLRACPSIKSLFLFDCEQLTSLQALEGHQRLAAVSAPRTPITSIDPLRSCPALKTVYLRGCDQLPSDVGLPASVLVIP